MQIIHRLDDFFFTLFPQMGKSDKNLIVRELQFFYLYVFFNPNVIINKRTQDFSPAKEGYFIPEKTFTGTQILAWFYKSWAIDKPEQVDKPGLYYAREWEIAKGMKGNLNA